MKKSEVAIPKITVLVDTHTPCGYYTTQQNI